MCVAYANTLHTSQGLTIPNPVYSHLYGGVSQSDEANSPGLAYTFFSRASHASDITLDRPLSTEFFRRLARFPSWKRLMDEDERLRKLATKRQLEEDEERETRLISASDDFKSDWSTLLCAARDGTYGEYSRTLAKRYRDSILRVELVAKLRRVHMWVWEQWKAAIAAIREEAEATASNV